MLNMRRWEILAFIAEERPIEEIDPPLEGTEVRYYNENKAYYDRIQSQRAPGAKFVFVPPDDIDYDESDEPWPPVYDD